MDKRLFLATALAAASCLALTPAPALAQAERYPERAVTIVVPFPAGGSTDMAGRLVAQLLQERLHGNFVVDNRPGATGTIGAGQVRRAPADGYTLMLSSLATFVVAPHLLKNVPYDALKDFDYLTVPVQAPNVLVAGPNQSARSVADVLALLRKDPDKISFASSGAGSSDHLGAELFWQQTGTRGLHVPYKGGAPAINDLLGGQVDFSFPNINAVLQHIRSGKLRAIAVTGSRRSAVLPDVPTLAESGVQGAEIYSWQGLVAPKGLPAALRKKISDAVVAGLQDPAVQKRMSEQGLEVVANTPEEFTAFQAREFARWKTLIETRKISVD